MLYTKAVLFSFVYIFDETLMREANPSIHLLVKQSWKFVLRGELRDGQPAADSAGYQVACIVT